jgi:ribosomal protein L37E
MATINDIIRRLVVRLAGEPVCDDCITERLELGVRTEADHATRALAGERGFERRKDPCALCGATKVAIRYSRT